VAKPSKFLDIINRSEMFVNAEIIGNPVSMILGILLEGREPQSIDSQLFNVIEFFNDSADVTWCSRVSELYVNKTQVTS
jgi:hypothetical protein